MSSIETRYINFSRHDVKTKIKIPRKLDESLCELVGMYLGDGHISCREGNKYLFQICGHIVKDKVYYERFVKNTLKSLFNIEKDPKYFQSNTFGYMIHSKGVVSFISQRFGFKLGKKEASIGIPKELFKNNKFLISCLRGIIDTDFYLCFDDKFPELGGWFSTKNLVKDIEKSLIHLGFNPKTRYDTKYFDKRTGKIYTRHHIRIRGKENVDKWFSLIKTHHPVLYTKYTYSKKGIYLKDKDIISNSKILELAPVV